MSISFEILRRLYHQVNYARSCKHRASFVRKMYLRLKWDCFVSLRSDIYYSNKIEIGKNVQIYEYATLNFLSGYNDYAKNIQIGQNTQIMPHAKIIPQQGFIRIGNNCTIQYGCLLYGVGGLEIGNDVRIGALSVITPMEHVYNNPLIPIWHQGEEKKGIRIGNDVWIGNSVKILDGVIVEDGCVIGAGSVVSRSLPCFSVAVGVPAKVIKIRGESKPPASRGTG
jgi:acetyltransferase-like isoleucine patch superfamily enzyme